MAVLAAIGMPSAAQQKGKATFYSKRANGSRTASGERIHSDSLVCAHRTHPFGTLLKVRNPANGKEVVVRVIDRGPFSRGRVIDLSYRAARELGIVAQGVAMVEVSVYKRKVEIPFKPDDGFDVPELDLEMTESDDKIVPQWQDEDEKTVAVPAKKRQENPQESLQCIRIKPRRRFQVSLLLLIVKVQGRLPKALRHIQVSRLFTKCNLSRSRKRDDFMVFIIFLEWLFNGLSTQASVC